VTYLVEDSVGPLVRKISESNMNILINHLCNPTPGKNEASSDVLDLGKYSIILVEKYAD
jgi:hypothetical protein